MPHRVSWTLMDRQSLMHALFLPIMAVVCLIPLPSYGFHFFVTTPPKVVVESSQADVTSDLASGTHRIRVPATLKGTPITLEFKGPYGGIAKQTIIPQKDGEFFSVGTGIINEAFSNPEYLSLLPALCPRVSDHGGKLVYAGNKDLFNHTPVMQLLDPDATPISQNVSDMQGTITEFDCHDVLLIDEVSMTFDYEDPQNVKAILPDGSLIREDHAGFYSNFHMAAFPYSADLTTLPPQTLLRIAEGRLSESKELRNAFSKDTIDRLKWRTHSFLPGPFLSRSDFFYSMCEWGDTARQAPKQTLHYDNLPIWDWDYNDEGQAIFLVIWEGDEEDGLITQGALSKSAIMDDLVEIFVVHAQDVDRGKTYTNAAHTVSIRLKTGNMSECR